MELSWSGIALLVLLLAYTEEPCKGNETNDLEVQKEPLREPVVTSHWPRYHATNDKVLLMVVGKLYT